MAPLSQAQVDALVKELNPRIDSKEKRVALGLEVYKKFLSAYPEYIKYFTKLEGLTIDNVFQSEGIKYYAGTLVDELVDMLTHAANDAELKKLTDKSGSEHINRKINKDQFMSGQKIFIEYFDSILTCADNKAAMKAFLTQIFPTIAGHL